MSSSSRKKRQRFSPLQVGQLENVYSQTHCPTSLVKAQLASDIGTTKRQVQVWFQNRRAKSKRQTAAKAAGTAATPTVSAANDPPSQPIQLKDLHHHETTTKGTSSLSLLNVSHTSTESNTDGMTERTPSIIQPRQSHSEVAQLFLYQPTYAIDTAGTGYNSHHHRFCAHQFQQPHVIRTFPPYASAQHQPSSSLRPSPQTMPPSFYLHDGPPAFNSRQTHPANYVSVIPNPVVPYFLSHENQQSQYLRHHQQQQQQHPSPSSSSRKA